MIDPYAEQVAHHKQVPILIHWQEDVKAGKDRDIRLGVVEPVLEPKEPVTWCHHMVVCAKKNGKPRRTVDLHSLNKHATRYTTIPYHQAQSIPLGTLKTVFDA